MGQNLRPGSESVRGVAGAGGVAFRATGVPIRVEQLPASCLHNPEKWLMPVIRCCLLAASTCVLVATAYGQDKSPLLLREPALSASEICFSFAGDLWTVPRTGGTAHRLTASPGTESG